jgi:hypothetical protein
MTPSDRLRLDAVSPHPATQQPSNAATQQRGNGARIIDGCLAAARTDSSASTMCDQRAAGSTRNRDECSMSFLGGSEWSRARFRFEGKKRGSGRCSGLTKRSPDRREADVDVRLKEGRLVSRIRKKAGANLPRSGSRRVQECDSPFGVTNGRDVAPLG